MMKIVFGLVSTSAVDPAGSLRSFADVLIQVGLLSAVLLGLIWLGRVAYREALIKRVIAQLPDQEAEIRAAGRRAPTLRRVRVPRDPYARTHPIIVTPLGDGRPGESFWAPGPAKSFGAPGADGSRTDVVVPLADGVYMLVVCLGRLGPRQDGFTVETADMRVELARAAIVAPQVALGPVDHLSTGAGAGWRTTSRFGTGRVLTDTHIDRDGWAFIIGVLSTSWHARAVEALDGILATWQWVSDEGTSPVVGYTE